MINVAANLALQAAQRAERDRQRNRRNREYNQRKGFDGNTVSIPKYPGRQDAVLKPNVVDTKMSLNEQHILCEYLREPQNWNHEYWQDRTRIDLYLIAYYTGMNLPSADTYVRLYDLFGVFVDVEKFLEVKQAMNNMGFDIFAASEGNLEYNVLKGLIGL